MKTLVVAIFGTAPWVVGTPGGPPKGHLAETLECAFRAAGLPVILKTLPMSRAYAMLEAGEVDAVAQGIRSQERDARYVPSAELTRSQSGWFTLASEGGATPTEFTSAAYRATGVFGVLASGANVHRLRRQGYLGGVEVHGESDALFRMLVRGRFRAVFANEKAIRNLSTVPEFTALRLNFAPHFSDSGVVYFHKASAPAKSPELLGRFNDALRGCPFDRAFM